MKKEEVEEKIDELEETAEEAQDALEKIADMTGNESIADAAEALEEGLTVWYKHKEKIIAGAVGILGFVAGYMV
jgi:hypothetical protein